jgi:hypothetical protein
MVPVITYKFSIFKAFVRRVQIQITIKKFTVGKHKKPTDELLLGSDVMQSGRSLLAFQTNTLSRVGVTTDGVLDWMIAFITHALGFSVYISRILATGSQKSHCHFKSHMKSSLHHLSSFLPLLCSCQFQRLNILNSSALKFISQMAGISNSTLHFTIMLCPAQVTFFVPL